MSEFARIVPWLLLRDDRGSADHAAANEAVSGGIRRRVQERLRLAEASQWHTLVSMAIPAAQARLKQPRDARARDSAPPNATLQRAAQMAVEGSLRGAARTLLGGAPLPPTQATKEAILDLYETAASRYQPPRQRPGKPAQRKLRSSIVTSRVRSARTTAHPGPSAERNAHVKALLASPQGAQVLTQWCDAWRQGCLSPGFRRPWLRSGVVPLPKDGGHTRPIVLQEALLKLATGAVVADSARKLEQALLPVQHGLGGEGGAARMIWQIRAAMAAAPDDIFVAVDCRNAFGCLRRETALLEAEQTCPELTGMFRSLWDGVSPVLLIDSPAGGQTRHEVADGLTQGGCDAQPAFCLGLNRVLRKVIAQCNERGIHVKLWAYVDDVVFQTAPCHAADVTAWMDAALRDAGLERRADKCKWYIPAGAVDANDIPSDVGTCQHHGLAVLGSFSDGKLATVVGLSGAQAEAAAEKAATERLDRANALAVRVRDLLLAPIDAPRLHAAWRLTAGVINEALSFDICVTPPGHLARLADRLDTLVDGLLAEIMGSGCTADVLRLCRLDRQHGGCGVPRTAGRCATAFLATVIRCPPPPSEQKDLWSIAGVSEHAQKCVQWLRDAGVHIDSWGMAHRDEPAEPLDPANLPQVSLPQRQRGWRAILGELEAASLARCAPWITSCQGPEGGAFLVSTPAEVGFSIADAVFQTALRFRLGLDVCTAAQCAHRTATRQQSSSRKCGCHLDTRGFHAILCKIGGGVTPIHDACCDRLLAAARAAGFRALREQVVPELADETRAEPRVDLEVWGLAAEPRALYDMTICAPFATRYKHAGGQPGAAAAAGEARKRREYPARGGVHVQGIAADAYGKIGPALDATLTKWADLARQRDLGRGTEPRRWLHLWRMQLSTEVAVGIAKRIATAEKDTCPSDKRGAPSPPAVGPEPGKHSCTADLPGSTGLAGEGCADFHACTDAPACSADMFAACPAFASEEDEAAQFLHGFDASISPPA